MKVSEWCDLWGMKLNASKTKSMIVSRSRTMHPQSPALTIDGTVLKESDDLVILGATFDSKMTFEKHLCSVSRAASQLLGILRKSWQVFNIVLPGLEYCPAVWCSAADTHLKLLNRVVRGASFLTGGVFECDVAHRRSVAVLCMLHKIRCNQSHLLYDVRLVPYVPVRVKRGAVIAHWFTYAPPSCIAGLLLHFQYPCGTILVTPYSMVWDLRFSRAGPKSLHWPSCTLRFCLLLFSFSLLSFYWLVLWGWGLRADRVFSALSQPCTEDLF